ncbi:gem-associated protein 8 [Perognathus longimembris pacificus]|uniref:gem-associated protein 8 n=1 Tax=Perognathus longimembris pacificus TaxID=214514 RepID=UPI002018DAD7|nr:gem-associated protein 8 [Perognathus longimembris pacificus]XP_048192450.1 gem-associated protein 8 [Perognathus longimembris pacificus]
MFLKIQCVKRSAHLDCPSLMEAMASTSRVPISWYSHPAYARYWEHYHQAMSWMRSHRKAYRKAMESYFRSLWYFPPTALPHSFWVNSPQVLYDYYMACQDSYCSYSHLGRSVQPAYDGNQTQASTSEDQSWFEEEEQMETESEGGIVCDLSNMEITDELRQYFAETERHREERRRQRELDAERLQEYVNADHGLYYMRPTVNPPTEKPGERRKAEMKILYGKNAPKIQAMETAVQLSFDKHCDKHQPKYWPVIPLKF